jgi:hypothetical protein
MRSLVEVFGIADVPFPRFAPAAVGSARCFFDEAFFTGCQPFRNAPLIQAAKLCAGPRGALLHLVSAMREAARIGLRLACDSV